MLIFISFDIVMVVLESDNEWRIYLGDASFANLEGVAAFVFSFLYVLRFIAAPYDRRANYSRWGYLTSFFGVADAIAFLPFFVELYWTAHGIPYDSCFFFFSMYWTGHGILYSMFVRCMPLPSRACLACGDDQSLFCFLLSFQRHPR
jgi:hypothetical protein